jgi:C1A family cysteine protease
MKIPNWLIIKIPLSTIIRFIWRHFIKKDMRKFGWIPQKPDKRDRKLTYMVRPLPEMVDLRPKDSPVYDQGNLGSCTGNAIAGAFEFEHIAEGLGDFKPSRLFIYYNERVIEHTVKKDAGAIIRDGFKVIGKGDKGVGVCSEDLWPYITSKFACKPSKKCFSEALKDLAIEYSALENNPAQLKGCLADGHPFVFGFTVYSNFMNIGSDGIMPLSEGSIEGGHAVMCVGYDDSRQVYIIRNSWGMDWGDKGYFYMPYEYMHGNLCSDFWTIRKVE